MVKGVRTAWCWPLCAIALSGCGADTPIGADRAGAGPTNDLPLWVPTPGTCEGGANGGGSRGHWASTEERLIDGRRVFLAGNPGPTEFFESSYGPAEPYFIRMYSRLPGGVYQIGDTRFGMYDEPVLVVPDKVRVGMRWYGAPFGTRRYTFEVSERSEVASSAGVVWYLEVTDDLRISRGAGLKDVFQAEPFTLSFLEGSAAGPFVARPEFHGIDVAVPGPCEAGVPAPATPPAVPALRLRPLNAGEPVAAGVVPEFVGLVADPAHPERLGLTLEGQAAGISGGEVGAVSFNAGTSLFCGTISRTGGTVAGIADPEQCASARGSVVDGTGRLLRIFEGGWAKALEVEGTDAVDGHLVIHYSRYQMGGIFRAADGSAQVFRTIREGAGLWLAPHPGGPARLKAMDPLPSSTFLGGLATGTLLWLPEEDATGWTNLIVEKAGVLRASHLTRAGVIDVEHTLRDLGGSLGLTVDSTSRRLLRSQVDGTIERVTWDRDGIHRVPLARAILPAGNVMVGAVEDGNRLVVFTLVGFEGTDVQYSLRFGDQDPTVKPELGRVLMWEMDRP